MEITMILQSLEEFLMKFSFTIYFIMTLICWINLIIYNKKEILYFLKKGMMLGHLGISGVLVIRWILSDHLPLSNLYESCLFLAWSLTFICLLLDKNIEDEWIYGIIAPSVMITYTFATLGLPIEMQKSTALVPALQSNWLMMHVSMMIFSYGTLLLGSLLAIILLTLSSIKLKENILNEKKTFIYIENTVLFQDNNSDHNRDIKQIESFYFKASKASLISQIDYWSYKMIGIGFPLLTIGILSGAVWANEAWGSYWSWDPKETWALITWLIFAIYLHIRMTQEWNAEKTAVVALLGFFVVWMCYLGVNLLGKGLHSYGWFN
jgi:cytochrome c-type biogenesis protein CcsB